MSGRHGAKDVDAELDTKIYGVKLDTKIYGADLATSTSALAWAQDLGVNYYGAETCNLGVNCYGAELRV